MMAPARLSDLATQHAGLLLSAAVVASLMTVSLQSGHFGQIGPDGDDVMRLVQVRELLDGKGWFDLTQTRLGPGSGTLMHWSRLVDLPIAALAMLMSPLLGREQALNAAITAWPVLSVLIVTCGLIAGARALGGRRLLLFACVLGFAVLFRHFRFLPGAIDHHNLQLGLTLLAAACLLPSPRPPGLAALSGAALALAAAIGGEVYVFVAAIAGFAALDWAIAGTPAQRSAVVFGASFAATLTAAFLATVNPLDYGAVWCDALSLVSLLAGLGGGAGFALAAQLTSRRSREVRLASLGLVGLMCGGLVVILAPQCLSNPLSTLSPEARALWLDRVDEARPTFALWAAQPDEVLFRLGTAGLGLAAAGYLAWKGMHTRAMMLFVLLLTVSLILALYQTRFYVFGQLFAVLPLAALVEKLQGREIGPGLPRPTFLFVLLAGVPMMWAAAGLALAPAVARPSAEAAASCLTPEAAVILSRLPPGRILAPPTDTPRLLLDTPHSALHGHYHRNADGIDAAIALFIAPPAEARQRFAEARLSYLLVCPADPDIRFFARQAPEGLIGRIAAGDVPSWLEPAARAGDTVVYRRRRG
ncbi:MAG: hypothetical protein ACK4HR_04510 [Hyphomonas sp.]|jgi:hypothetical protein